jgi:hypothetical protein
VERTVKKHVHTEALLGYDRRNFSRDEIRWRIAALNDHSEFAGLEYLRHGSRRQQHAFSVLKELGIFGTLADYGPVLVGTVPIGIDIEGSDLDVACFVKEQEWAAFGLLVESNFSQLQDYRCVPRTIHGLKRVVVNFTFRGWPVEIFAQSVPTVLQNGYRHMVIEHRILKLMGPAGYEAVRALKRNGWKTEPAFAELLRLEGDPYEALLALYDWKEEALAARIELTQYP